MTSEYNDKSFTITIKCHSVCYYCNYKSNHLICDVCFKKYYGGYLLKARTDLSNEKHIIRHKRTYLNTLISALAKKNSQQGATK